MTTHQHESLTTTPGFRIAVHDPLPLYRVGVMTCLADVGLHSEAPLDLLAWTRSADVRVILLTLCHGADWDLLTELCDEVPRPLVIALLEDDSVAAYVRAVRAGAVGAASRAAEADQLRSVVEATVRGNVLLPREVIQAMVESPVPEFDAAIPTVREQQWLRELAAGVTVGHLAERSGYSERMMFRLLSQLYNKLGVRGRTESLIFAKEQGWL